ncbi:hypothetical protein D3H55_15770 [Bacillus salacetis]|uniref:YqgU-like 6-bladed beta-propeller domain-containing protein n=1 Tax=Bacillus salacetis TaxID=2315464 RepID=A0A3A1QTS0_9BACI|nr:hypothetical protein [Bacillus salacetis]RIW31065.1 hypothetical protein D3H55_15770 [Bacillus salacetis]
MKKVNRLFFILICFFLLASCSGNLPENNGNEQSESAEEQPVGQEKEILPLIMKEDAFIKVIDWIDSEKILILSKGENGNQLLQYNLFTGDQKVLYEDPEYIVDAQVGPDRNRILVHTAPLTYSAAVTVIDLNGKVLFQESIESYEIAFEWNEDNADLLFITSFAEDWSFKTMLADISKDTLNEVAAPQPFIKWQNDNSFLYQDWPEESISLSAPLYSRNLYSEESALVQEGTIHFDSMTPYILSVSLAEGTEGTGIYEFITKDGTISSSFSQPLLSSYSNWVIPYYDKIDTEAEFVSLSAVKSVPADTYQDKFTLERWNIKTGEREELMTGMENQPLQCSPNGEYCLTGYELKTAVDLSSKEAKDVIILE